MDFLTLNNGQTIPQLGFGVFQVPPDETYTAVRTALDAGYRHIDTAAAYRNEEGVGKAVTDSGIDRSELYLTTKLWNSDQGQPEKALEDSLRRLGVDYVDLYLVHWPLPKRDLYVGVWKVLEGVYRSGRARSIGVSNFTVHTLNRLMSETEVRPVLNQVELHPRFTQAELRAFHAEHQIATEAWGPLGQGGPVLQDPTVVSIASAHGVSAAQAVIRWHLQVGNVVIPKSATPERIASNFDVFGFALTDEEVAMISGLDDGGRLGPDPAEFDYAPGL